MKAATFSTFRFHWFVIALTLNLIHTAATAQDNVGIGTDTIHPSAILQIEDSTKGLLIPRTDTASVNAYVSSLIPNPGIADGLMIFDPGERKYFYYDGALGFWVQINRLQGEIGVTGPTGPIGPTGLNGRSTNWRDSAYAMPFKRPGDTCGDYYHQTGTGLIWRFNCDSNDWVGPIARWRMLGYGETHLLRASTLIYAPMPDTPGEDSLFLIAGLSHEIRVPPDTVAHVTITAQGMVQKRLPNSATFNYAKFDFFLTEPPGPPGSYLNHSKTVAINPNSPPFAGNPDGLYDKVPWSITTSMKLEGKISPAGNPLPATDFLTWSIECHGGQRHAAGNTLGPASDIILVDGGTGKNGLWENYAVMNVYIVYERSKKAAYPE
jgi:hypothetical protein